MYVNTWPRYTKWRRNVAKNFNQLSRVHERYRRQTNDGRATAYSERNENMMKYDDDMNLSTRSLKKEAGLEGLSEK